MVCLLIPINIVGDINSEICDSAKRAKFIASRLCMADENAMVVYDSALSMIFIKDVSKCEPPITHATRLSILSKSVIIKRGEENHL